MTMTRPAHAASTDARTALSAFRDVHAGADVVVCGCGSSLLGLARPERLITIGVNDVGRLFDPTYLVVVNPRNQFKTDRFRFVEGSKARALFTQLDLGRVQPPVVRFKLGQYGGTDACAGETLHYAQNSPYVAVCLAAYMGARRIGLVGVDLTDHHFFAATGRHALAARLREIDGQYGRLAAALHARGVALVNLSPISRLTSLSRGHIDADGAIQIDGGAKPFIHSEGTAMKVAIEGRSGPGLVGQLLDTLAASAAKLGHVVVRDARAAAHDPRVISIVWNGRRHVSRGPTLYCEHGWLPRSAYQISPTGINARSHLAPFTWDGTPLTAQEDAALDAHIAAIKATAFEGYYQYMQAATEASSELPAAFLLVPLQIESDTNIVYHAPAPLRTMQGLVDHVARMNPPWPVIFKQHPADARRGNRHLRLQLRRSQDLFWPQSRGNIHQMLQSGGCRGIITINSNVAHDGLLWNVPAVVLGKNVWPTAGPHLPFLAAFPRDWTALEHSAASPEGIACRRAYAYYLVKNQWTLADARDPKKVAALLARTRANRPAERRTVHFARVAPPRPKLPIINVVAENRGWLFEAWKRAFAAASCPGFDVVASNRPLPQAASWIFIRAREAAATPDAGRTVVQLHDLLDGGAYRPGGQRAAVAKCAGLSLTHPDQQALLAANGIDVRTRRWLLQPVGWSGKTDGAEVSDATPAIAWIGRPAMQGGEDVARLAWFLEAAAALRHRPRVMLIGEKIEHAAAKLRRAGLQCQAGSTDKFPPLRASAWIGRFDCVAICGGVDTGPWPVFDALHAGVPVVAAPVGWAGRLLADGTCGRIAEGPAAIGQAIDEVLAEREAWRSRRAEVRAAVADLSLPSWIANNLALAVDLARHDAVHEVA